MENLEKIIEQVTKKLSLTNLQEIYRGYYYSQDHVRNIIFKCEYQGKQAVLKVYDDPRESREPTALIAFHQHNKSQLLKAPTVYAHEEISANTGWLLMEKLPDSAQRFEKNLSDQGRKEFLQMFLEYRLNFPTETVLEKSLPEYLNSTNFHLFRINRWLELATKQNSNYFLQTGQHITDPQILISKLQYSLNLIREVFMDRPMLWSHGHFKNHELFKVSDQEYWLLDFAHSKLFPQGYELAFMIWSDYLMSENWQNTTTQDWLRGLNPWINETIDLAKKLKY
ncbi:hypothetical protein IT411_01535, partial [Candidatus Peregrinibacteria bacterium]|nr:hypothetical protein [Candidatus Peregrinibacteria bacterium]